MSCGTGSARSRSGSSGGGLIAIDNVLWSGRVLNPDSVFDKAIVALNKKVQADDRVDQVMLTVRDGLYLARKR